MVCGGALKTIYCAAGPDAEGGAEEVDMEDGVGAGWGDDLDLEPKADADELDEDMIANGDEEAEDGEGGWEMEVHPFTPRLYSTFNTRFASSTSNIPVVLPNLSVPSGSIPWSLLSFSLCIATACPM